MTSIQPSSDYRAEDQPFLLYIGTYAEAEDAGIYLYHMDPASGKLTLFDSTRAGASPSFLEVHPDGHHLYAVNELFTLQGPPNGAVSALTIDPSSGKLALINQQRSHGNAPCHLTLDPAGRFLFVANYFSGTLAVFPLGVGGRLEEASQVIDQAGLRGVPQEMVAALVGGGDAIALQQVEHLGAGEAVAALECGAEKLLAAFEDGGGEFEVGLAAPVGGQHARGGEAQHPCGVFGWDEVDGAAHGPGADDFCTGDGPFNVGEGGGGGAQAQRPHGLGVILGLDGAQAAHDGFGALELRAGDALVE